MRQESSACGKGGHWPYGSAAAANDIPGAYIETREEEEIGEAEGEHIIA